MKDQKKIFLLSKPWALGLIFLFSTSLFNPQCKSPTKVLAVFPYAIDKPDSVYLLNQKLAEVSGLSFISDHEVALIQDEAGSVFIYDLGKKKVTKTVSFSGKGDYEDLKVLGDTVYILRSDGTLSEVPEFSSRRPKLSENKFNTALSQKNDTEGLCYDDKKHTLLIACKGAAELKKSEDNYKNKKAVYEFDLQTKLLSDTPVYLISINEVDQMARGMYSNAIEKFVKFYKRTSLVKDFEPSGLAIHPSTRDIYIISSSSKLLVILNAEGRLSNVVKLPPRVFKQPEGIAFDDAGNLFISNEGRDGLGNILKFRIQKNKSLLSES